MMDPEHVQLVHIREFQYEIYNNNRVDQTPNGSCLTFIRPKNDLFVISIDYSTYILMEQAFRYNDDVANDLNKMTKTAAAQLKDQTFSSKDNASITTFS